MRRRVLTKSRSRAAARYFAHQFPEVSRPTIAALSRRMEALFASEGVRLALAGSTAPDFRRLQDEAGIVLINCAGTNLARSVRRLLQCLLLSDIGKGAFSREGKESTFLWLLDEAQTLFGTPLR